MIHFRGRSLFSAFAFEFRHWAGLGAVLLVSALPVQSTPANKAALEKHYDRFLARDLARCATCHLPSALKDPQSLDEFPHNPFGVRLRALGLELTRAGKKVDLADRLDLIAQEDADGDGANNQAEILLGHQPGDPLDKPTPGQKSSLPELAQEFAAFQRGYRWRPFERVSQPAIPGTPNVRARNPIDHFIAAEHQKRKLTPRPEAPKLVLLRRLYVDVIGLLPTPAEQTAFVNDPSPDAYEHAVDRLLQDARYGERWGRHWMDIWRYSDWGGWSGGNQIRDSKPHIWRWRDWIIESLNADKGYDQMILEMLAADELTPENPEALRATGFLARNYKMLSREQWMEDTVKHTAQAFLGVTMGCAKCHDHMYDPISQAEYYQFRAVFEPHQVRTDRVPGEPDITRNGLVRVYDTVTNAPTYFFPRGDERKPDTNRVMAPGVPRAFTSAQSGWSAPTTVALPLRASMPDRRPFVVRDLIAASEAKRAAAEQQSAANPASPEQPLKLELARAQHVSLLAMLDAERIEEGFGKENPAWRAAATNAVVAQRRSAVAQAQLARYQAAETQRTAQQKADKAPVVEPAAEPPAGEAKEVTEQARKAAEQAAKELATAKDKLGEAEKAVTQAEQAATLVPSTNFTPRSSEVYPQASTGRRLALAKWMVNANNPLTARVAINHIWLRHFGRGLVASTVDFGRNGSLPSHPELLDWLAAELPARGWSMKSIHRLILTSATYRLDSTPDPAQAAVDPDNLYLWRMPPRRMEAELIRDNLLYAAGDLDLTMGGPEIDHNLGFKSKRRSVYLRIAPEKEVEFLRIFDGPAVTECYQRRPSIVPQQALALANSELALTQAHRIAESISAGIGQRFVPAQFVAAAFVRLLGRGPTDEEIRLCEEFLGQTRDVATASAELQLVAQTKSDAPLPDASKVKRNRAHLVLVLLNHHEFVTIR